MKLASKAPPIREQAAMPAVKSRPLNRHLRTMPLWSNFGPVQFTTNEVEYSHSSQGAPLDRQTKQLMESRFDQDFSQVRIHTGQQAATSAQAIQAKAYTNGTTGLVQRESPPANDDAESSPKFLKRRDIVFVMAFEEAAQLASADAEFFHVKTPEEMAEKLKGINFPIGTIYVFAHSSTTANIKFPDSGFVTASSLAATLKDSIHPFWVPEAIDFRGCSVGMNPAGMEEIRQATRASAVIGSSCFLVFMTLPFTVDGVHIKTRQQLKDPKNKVTWNKHFPTHWKKFDSSPCVLDKSADAYFKAGGFLVSIYANKEFTTAYSPTTSVCYNDLPVTSIAPQDAMTYTPQPADPCTLIRVDVGAQTQTPVPTPSTKPIIEEQTGSGN